MRHLRENCTRGCYVACVELDGNEILGGNPRWKVGRGVLFVGHASVTAERDFPRENCIE